MDNRSLPSVLEHVRRNRVPKLDRKRQARFRIIDLFLSYTPFVIGSHGLGLFFLTANSFFEGFPIM
jgi:hypothetical protein